MDMRLRTIARNLRRTLLRTTACFESAVGVTNENLPSPNSLLANFIVIGPLRKVFPRKNTCWKSLGALRRFAFLSKAVKLRSNLDRQTLSALTAPASKHILGRFSPTAL